MDTDTIQKRGGALRVISAVALVVVVVAVAVLGGWWVMNDREESVSTVEDAAVSISQDDLAAAAQARVFLGHQSVGANLLEGIPAVYQSAGLTPPQITTEPVAGASDGLVAHAYIGENTQPLGKIEAFDKILRDGMAADTNVAAMKLCYLDISPTVDVDAIFAAYQETAESLQRDYPELTLLHITTPLTTQSTGWKATVKRILGRPDSNAADNVAREKYNQLMRQAYAGSNKLFDLAAMQSTAPDGSRVVGEYEGSTYYALAPQYAADPGHLNEVGSQIAAGQFLALVAQAN